MSERYVPPPPPYELSLQRDQKVAEEVQALATPKERPFHGDEFNDNKHSKARIGNPLVDALPNTAKRPTSAGFRAPRPLPPSPAGIADVRPLAPRRQESKLRPVVEVKMCGVRDDDVSEPQSPAPPPFSETEQSAAETVYMQNILYPSTSIHPSPSHYPPQPSHDTPYRHYDSRRPSSVYSPKEPSAETSGRRLSHVHSHSAPYSLPQNSSYGIRLPFDPSVAYSNSQAGPGSAFSMQRGMSTSLYNSAVSSHLHPDSVMIPGTRPSFASARHAPRHTENSRLDKTDVASVRSHPPSVMYPSPPPPPSSYIQRPKSSGGYEQRWAISESDITRDVYRR